MSLHGSSTWIRRDVLGPGDCGINSAPTRQAAFIAAPSMTMPAVTYFQSAIAWTDQEVLPFARLEIQGAAQRYDQLPDGRVMPGEGAAGGCLFKRDGRRRRFAAQHVAALAGLKVDD